MGRTLPSLSVTNTGFSPLSTHFFVQASWAALAPLAPHLESLIQPAHLLSLAKAGTHIKTQRQVASPNFFIWSSPVKRFVPCKQRCFAPADCDNTSRREPPAWAYGKKL